MNTYYFPINSSSLAHYFSGACIKAAKYFNNKPQDIQDGYSEFLLLTEKKGTSATDCCLELILSKEEIRDLIDARNGWYLLNTNPLPITRIKKIFFSDKEQLSNTITNIRMSTAFVPDGILDVCTFDENPVDAQIPTDCKSVDQTNKINQYDRFLGALALMRLAHEPYMNYSQNYFATLSFFNHIIDSQIKLNNNLSFKYAFQGIFNNSKGFEKVLPYLKHNIDENALNKIAQENNQVIKKDKITRVIDEESITDTWTYTIAILNAYGVGDESRKKRIDGLIQSHFKSLKEEKREGVALCYGYNRGYSAFTKSYGDVAFKYKLESQLDYYTIESVYQYVFFNGKVSSDFPDLDSWCPKQKPKSPKSSTEYVILGELIVGEVKAKDHSQELQIGVVQNNEKPIKILERVKTLIEKEGEKELLESYQEELEKIKRTQEELLKARNKFDESQETIRQLRKELEMLNSIKACTISEHQNREFVVTEANSEYGTENSLNETLKREVVKHKDSTLKELKKSSRAKDTSTLCELLLNLVDLFSK